MSETKWNSLLKLAHEINTHPDKERMWLEVLNYLVNQPIPAVAPGVADAGKKLIESGE